jgi:hypothetical protein
MVSGSIGVKSFADQSIAAWQSTPGSAPQGFSSYFASDPVNTNPSVGTGTNYRKASSALTPIGAVIQ